MTRSLAHVRTHAIAYVALFVALGGTSYAAVRLPAHSVGKRQLRKGAVTPGKLSKGARKRPRGRTGARGATGATGRTGGVGPVGPRGADAPGTLSFDQQSTLGVEATLTTVAGIKITYICGTVNTEHATLQPAAAGDTLYGWGTRVDGATVSPVQVLGKALEALGSANAVNAALVAQASGPDGGRGYVHVDISVIRGTKCNVHALVVPPAG